MSGINPTLYHLTADLLELEAALRMAEETGDPAEEILAQYLTTGSNLAEKAERYGHLIVQRQAEAQVARAAIDALVEEMNRLIQRETAAAKDADRLKAALHGALTVLDIRELKSATFSFKRVGNGGQPPMLLDAVNLSLVPEEFTRPQLDKDKIREALERGESVCIIDPDTGEAVPFARLLPRGEHVRIR